jgi:hypothetical protein
MTNQIKFRVTLERGETVSDESWFFDSEGEARFKAEWLAHCYRGAEIIQGGIGVYSGRIFIVDAAPKA